MLLAVRVEAFVVRAATSSSLTSSAAVTGSRGTVAFAPPLTSRRHRPVPFTGARARVHAFSSSSSSSSSSSNSIRWHSSAAAAAQRKVASRAPATDLSFTSDTFYPSQSTSSASSSSSFNLSSDDPFASFFAAGSDPTPTDTPFRGQDMKAWLTDSDASVFNPRESTFGASSADDIFSAPFETSSTQTHYEERGSFQYGWPPSAAAPPASSPNTSTNTLPTFQHMQQPYASVQPQPAPQPQPLDLDTFSWASSFPRTPPRVSRDAPRKSLRSDPYRDPRKLSEYEFRVSAKSTSGENVRDVASTTQLDIRNFDEVITAKKERHTKVDYTKLPRAKTTTMSSSYARRDRRAGDTNFSSGSGSLTPDLARKVREERNLLRKQAESAALESALKMAQGGPKVEADVAKVAEEEAAALAEKKRKAAERRAKSVAPIELPLATTVRGLSQMFSKKTDEIVSALATLGYEKLRKPTHIVRQKIIKALADHYSVPCVLENHSVADVYARSELSENAKMRSPLVCVMGHVDHGKTTLIDCIRKTTLAAKEAGGITQKIGAFAVKPANSGGLTIFDTPGHEAFSMMRARGASLVDVVILVVAADDGVMPQTVESIRMVKAAQVPFAVAITKCDLREAKPDLVRAQLMEHGIYSESDNGSDGVIIEEVSGKTGQGVEGLVDLVVMRGELEEPMAEFSGPAEAVVIESAVDKRNGVLANVLVRHGELKVGDCFVVGTEYGKVKQLRDQNNQMVKSALPSTPVSIVGARELPNIGDNLLVVENEKKARQVCEYRKEKQSRKNQKTQTLWQSEDIFAEKAQTKQFHSLLKADCMGSIEAVESFFSSLDAPNDEVAMSLVKSATGPVTEGDVKLAQSTGALIHAFNVKVTPQARKLAKQNNVEIRENNVIFHLMDDVLDLMSASLSAVFEHKNVGRALVKKTFKGGKLAGCVVSEGSLLSRENHGFRIVRNGDVIFEQDHAPFTSLQRFDKVVQEVAQGVECGVDVGGVVVEPGDVLECVERVQLERRVTTKIAQVCQTQWQSLFQSTHTRSLTVQEKHEENAEGNAQQELEAVFSSDETTEVHSERKQVEVEEITAAASAEESKNAELSNKEKEALKSVGQELARAQARQHLSDILQESSSKHYA